MLPFFFAVISFKIEVANRYKLNKSLKKLATKLAEEPGNIPLRNQVSKAKVREFFICYNTPTSHFRERERERIDFKGEENKMQILRDGRI